VVELVLSCRGAAQHVGGLDVAVNQAHLVSGVQRRRHLGHDVAGPGRRQRAVLL
jgi:hypothetical protein